MGQKVHPLSFRLPINRNWLSRWYANKKDFYKYIYQDYLIRDFINKKLKYSSISKVFIERASIKTRIKIFTSRPGIVIGRKGQELEKLKLSLQKITFQNIILDVQEVKNPDLVAKLVAENIAMQLERRISFRRAMKKAILNTMNMGAEGIKIQCSGRLGGTEIARTESQRSGRVPLHTLREKIDYGFVRSNTSYGTIGVKCWICTSEKNN